MNSTRGKSLIRELQLYIRAEQAQMRTSSYRLADMPTDPNGGSGEVTALSLQLLGAFHHLQKLMDDIARKFFEQSIPKVANIIQKRLISRIKDEERVDLLLAISSQLEADANLESFRSVFTQVKAMRDSLAHSAAIDAVGVDQLKIVKSLIDSGIEPEGSHISRSEIEAAIQRCRWLEMQALYVSGFGLQREIGLGPVLVTLKRPADRPELWDGNVFLYGSRPRD